MELIYEKDLNQRSYIASTKSTNYFALATSEGVDIFNSENKKLLFSIVNFSDIKDLIITGNEKYLIIINSKQNIYCYDLDSRVELSRIENFGMKYGKLLSLTTSINDKELIILSFDKEIKDKTLIYTFSLPSLKLNNVYDELPQAKIIRKDKQFKKYFLVSFLDDVYFLDESLNIEGTLEKSLDVFNIKEIVSINNPIRLIVQDFKKLYVYNLQFNLVDEITLVSNNPISKDIKFIESFDDDPTINFRKFIDSKLVFSFGIFKNNYSLCVVDNLLASSTSLNLNDINTSATICSKKLLTPIGAILILDDDIIISGTDGTYIFRLENSDTLNLNEVSLGMLHKTNLISKIKT